MTDAIEKLPNCTRCGHFPDDHRFDDTTIGFDGVTSHTDPGAKFRCVMTDDGCGCPDYQR